MFPFVYNSAPLRSSQEVIYLPETGRLSVSLIISPPPHSHVVLLSVVGTLTFSESKLHNVGEILGEEKKRGTGKANGAEANGL